MTFFTKKELYLSEAVAKATKRFPILFDPGLKKHFHQLIASASTEFIQTRPLNHLYRLLLIQFFFHKNKKVGDLQVKVFREYPHRLCIALLLPIEHEQEVFGLEHLLKACQKSLPSIKKIQGSFYTWQFPEEPYLFCYLEVQTLRGKEPAFREIQKSIKEQINHSIVPLSIPLFWPYNQEESYRQLLLLKQKINKKHDLPHVLIQFREQTPDSLEFIIHLARPATSSLLEVSTLPSSMAFLSHLNHKIGKIEVVLFSLHIPLDLFHENDTINLLQARKYVEKYVEKWIGPFRDQNGKLFRKQRLSFEILKKNLSNKIPLFHLFAEKLFFSLHPMEDDDTLDPDTKDFAMEHHPKGILVVKAKKGSDLLAFNQKNRISQKATSVQLRLGCDHYLCRLNDKEKDCLKSPDSLNRKEKMLHFCFQDGEPPSLHPHHIFGDIRCRALSKLLFEGLTRLDHRGKPILAGAERVFCSIDGLRYTFKLRPHLWSNGERVTAFHYEKSWKRFLYQHGSIGPFLTLKNSKKSPHELGVRAQDDKTLNIELEFPDPSFLEKLSLPLFFPLYEEMEEPRVFNGPFLSNNKDSHVLSLDRNPYFWDRDSVFFQHILISSVSDVNKAYALFQKGEIDWIGDPFNHLTPSLLAELQNKENTHRQQVIRPFWIYLNTRSFPLTSASFRQALNLAIDRSVISKHILIDSLPLYTPLPPPLSHLSSSPSANSYCQAKQLFEKGLQELNLNRNNCPPITLSYFESSIMENFANYLKQSWKKAFGIKICLEKREWNEFLSKLEKRNFQMGGCFESLLYQNPIELLERFEQPRYNFSNWTSPHYQKKIESLRQTTNPSLRKKQIKEAEEILHKETPLIPISNGIHYFCHHPKLKGYVVDQSGCIDFRWARFEG